MDLVGNLRLLSSVLLWISFYTFSLCYSFCQTIGWWWTGVLHQKHISRELGNYESSAHIMRIRFCYKLDAFIMTQITDYILAHHTFTAPEYVLRDDVHLLQITDKDAIFMQLSPEAKGPENYPFASMAFDTSPRNIITMPLESFHKLAERITMRNTKLVILQSVGRCGGTLMSDVFRSTGRCFALGEPQALTKAMHLFDLHKDWSRDKKVKLIRDVITLLYKHSKNSSGKFLTCVMKPVPLAMLYVDLIKEAFPDAIQFFLYRDPVQVAVSFRKCIEGIPSFGVLFRLLPRVPGVAAYHLWFCGYMYDLFQGWYPKLSMDIEWGYWTQGKTVQAYIRSREDGLQIHAIRYEQACKTPRQTVSKVFKICGLSPDLIQDAVKAFEWDSQRGSTISKDSLGKAVLHELHITQEIRDVMIKTSQELGIPVPDDWDDDFLLPGTI